MSTCKPKPKTRYVIHVYFDWASLTLFTAYEGGAVLSEIEAVKIWLMRVRGAATTAASEACHVMCNVQCIV